jgi:hypothetical protein
MSLAISPQHLAISTLKGSVLLITPSICLMALQPTDLLGRSQCALVALVEVECSPCVRAGWGGRWARSPSCRRAGQLRTWSTPARPALGRVQSFHLRRPASAARRRTCRRTTTWCSRSHGRPIDPQDDWEECKTLLKMAGVGDARLRAQALACRLRQANTWNGGRSAGGGGRDGCPTPSSASGNGHVPAARRYAHCLTRGYDSGKPP